MTDEAERVQYLMDRTKIIETMYLYATGIDTKDWALYRTIFADEIKIDFGSHVGGPPGWTHMSADEWTAQLIDVFAGMESTQHSMSNPRVEIDGDVARCVMYMQAEHYLKNDQGDDFFTIGGYYTNDLVRSGDGWKLTAVKLTVLWQRGNRHIAAAADQAITEQTANLVNPPS
jgi:3-phenylpropionate/cinnamic acid dioxygenase small subunit